MRYRNRVMHRTCTTSKMPTLVCCELLLSRTRCSEQSEQATVPQTDKRVVSQLPGVLRGRKTGWSMDVIELTKSCAATPKFLFSMASCCSSKHLFPGVISLKFASSLEKYTFIFQAWKRQGEKQASSGWKHHNLFSCMFSSLSLQIFSMFLSKMFHYKVFSTAKKKFSCCWMTPISNHSLLYIMHRQYRITL